MFYFFFCFIFMVLSCFWCVSATVCYLFSAVVGICFLLNTWNLSVVQPYDRIPICCILEGRILSDCLSNYVLTPKRGIMSVFSLPFSLFLVGGPVPLTRDLLFYFLLITYFHALSCKQKKSIMFLRSLHLDSLAMQLPCNVFGQRSPTTTTRFSFLPLFISLFSFSLTLLLLHYHVGLLHPAYT